MKTKIVLVENYFRTRQALYVRGELVLEEQKDVHHYLDYVPDIFALAGIPLKVVEVNPAWLRRRKHFPKKLSQVKFA